MTAEEHSRLLSIFFFIQGGLQLFGGIFVVLIYGVMGGAMLATSRREDEQIVGGIFLAIAVVLGVLMLAFSGLYIFTGFKLKKEQPAGRVLGIICSILSLLGFPLGTALGVYGLWFFFGDLGREFYVGSGRYSTPPPPPPEGWR